MDLQYDFDTKQKYAAVVHMHKPQPRLSDQLEAPTRIVEFDWVPDYCEVILIAGTNRYELQRLATDMAAERLEKGHDPEDREAPARAWWASRPGPDASNMTFVEWRDAMPHLIGRIEVVPTTAFLKEVT